LWSLKNKAECDITYVGIKNHDCDYIASNIEMNESGCRFDCCGEKFEVNIAGEHNVYNALSAIACGVHYNIAPQRIVEGIENFTLTKMRMSVERTNKVTIINDCYNSSPDSVNAALKVLSTEKTRKVAILGDILEMGDYASEAHYKLGESVYENKIDLLITVGENAKQIAKGAEEAGLNPDMIKSFNDTDTAVGEVANYIKDGDSILVKASRGMKFEQIVEAIKNEF